MKGILYLLGLRAKQGYRALLTVGWALMLIALPLFIILMLGVFEGSADGGWKLSVIFVAIVFGIQSSRSDKKHLKSFGFIPSLVFAIEYASLGLILGLINLVLVKDWQNLVFMMGLGALIGFLPQSNFSNLKTYFFFPVNWMPTASFEWRSGLRKMGWVIFLMTLISIIFAHHSPAVPIVALLLIQIFTSGWYKDFEPMALFTNNSNPNSILSLKVLNQIALGSLINIPLYIIYLIHFSELWYVLLVAIILGHMVNCFAIFYKYAGYHPSRRRTQSDVAVAIFALSTYLPFLAPITLFYLGIYYFKAKRNIKTIYADC